MWEWIVDIERGSWKVIPNSNIRVSARAHVSVCACMHACTHVPRVMYCIDALIGK